MYDLWTRALLRMSGMSPRGITSAVREGELIRARRDRYLTADTPTRVVEAVRIGGRLSCVSLLAELGVFVFDASVLHVHMIRGASRMRSRGSRRKKLAPRRRRHSVVLHWHALVEEPADACVAVIDALIHAVRCQPPRHAIATLDSALHLGLISSEGLSTVFAALPQRFQVVRDLLDGRAESGTETLVRLMARALGCRIDLQVSFEGVGFVDLVLDGWLVVECDSKQFHSSWEQQLKDYRRDQLLAAAGMCVLRLTAADILHEPERVIDSLRGLIRTRRPVA